MKRYAYDSKCFLLPNKRGALTAANRQQSSRLSSYVAAVGMLALMLASIVACAPAKNSAGSLAPSLHSSEGAVDRISYEEALTLLMERMNHVEGLLVGSLLGFFLTAAAGSFAAAHSMRSEKKALSFTPRQFFYGIVLAFGFVSGFYYFMLAQYYAALGTILGLLREGDGFPIHELYATLRVPLLPAQTGNVIMLANPPVFPFAVSSALTIGLYLYMRDPAKETLSPKDLGSALTFHFLLCPLMLWHPFVSFLKAGPLRGM